MEKASYIKFKDKGVSVGYKMIYTEEDGGMVTSYIEGFDIAFSSPSLDVAQERAPKMIKSFFDYWIVQESWKQFILKIHKLGFRTEMHDLEMKKMLNNQRPKHNRFEAKSSKVDSIFSGKENLKSINTEAELAY